MTQLDQKLRDRIKKATTINTGNYHNPNTRGVVAIKNFKLQEGYKGTTIVVELEVVSSEGKAAKEGVPEGKPHKQGDDFSRVMNLTGGSKTAQDMAWNNLLSLLQAVQQSVQMSEGQAVTPIEAEKSDEILEAALAKNQPFRGIVLNYDTVDKHNDKGEARSYMDVKPAAGNKREDVNTRRKSLDERKPLTSN